MKKMKIIRLSYNPNDLLTNIMFTKMLKVGRWEALYILSCPFPAYCLN